MKVKKAFKKEFRRIRHKVCRTIVYWDSCPSGYRKNRTKQFIQAMYCVAFTAAFISIMSAVFIIFN